VTDVTSFQGKSTHAHLRTRTHRSALERGQWVDTGKTATDMTYPEIGGSAILTMGGTCVARTTKHTATALTAIPTGTGIDCLRFAARLTSEGLFTFQVDDPGAPANGYYLGDGNNGGVLDLLSAQPFMTFAAPEDPATTLVGELTTQASAPMAGDQLTTSLTITNTGNTRLTKIIASDSLDSKLDCGTGSSIVPGDSITCVGSVTLGQATIDAGTVTDDFTVAAATFSGAPVSYITHATHTISANSSGSLALELPATGTLTAGEQLTATVVATNTGNVTLSGITVEGGTCPSGVLAPNKTLSCALAHTVSQEEIDHGSIEIVATGSATAPDDTTVHLSDARSNVDAPEHPSAQLSVHSDAGDNLRPGDTISYTAEVTNSGNVTLNGLALVNATCAESSLAPGAKTKCTLSHVVTQTDIDAGQVKTAVSGSARSPQGTNVAIGEQIVTDEIKPLPSASVTITSGEIASDAAGKPSSSSRLSTREMSLSAASISTKPVAPRQSSPRVPHISADSNPRSHRTTSIADASRSPSPALRKLLVANR
jgi:uncharacterized repeat protein (TIGR01451 family)